MASGDALESCSRRAAARCAASRSATDSVLVDRPAHERMHEHGGVHPRQHLDPQHARRGRGGCLLVEPGQGGRVGEPTAIEDRHRPCERHGLRADTGNASDDAVAQRQYRGVVDHRSGGLVPFSRDRLQQLAQVERVAGGGGETRGAQGLVGSRNGHADHRGHRGRPQGAQGDPDGIGLGAQRVEQRHRGVGLVRAERHDQGDRQVGDPAGEVRQRVHRGRVDPMQVIHHEHHRRGLGEVRHEPVDPVQRGEAAFRGGHRRGAHAIRGEHPLGRGGGPREQVRTPGRRRDGQHQLEQLADHSERQAALQFATTRPQYPEPARGRFLRRGGQQCALAVPGRALDHDQGAAARTGPRPGRAEQVKLRPAFVQMPVAHVHHGPIRSLTALRRIFGTGAGYRSSLPLPAANSTDADRY